MRLSIVVTLTIILSSAGVSAHVSPFDGKEFKGRIAYCADGNFNDEDDWAASAFALAIFAEFGVKDKLVHFDYNCILPKTDKAWESEHKKSILGSIEHFSFSPTVLHDCQQDLDDAVNSIRDAINSSSAEDPLYLILAGPMEVPALGIAKSDPEKRKYVYCISHNVWNDGFSQGIILKMDTKTIINRIVIPVLLFNILSYLPFSLSGEYKTSNYGGSDWRNEWHPRFMINHHIGCSGIERNLWNGAVGISFQRAMIYLFFCAQSWNMAIDFAKTPADPLKFAEPSGVPSILYHS